MAALRRCEAGGSILNLGNTDSSIHKRSSGLCQISLLFLIFREALSLVVSLRQRSRGDAVQQVCNGYSDLWARLQTYNHTCNC